MSSRSAAAEELEEAVIQLVWSHAGRVAIDAERCLEWPGVPSGAGIYRFSFRSARGHLEAVYIGESSDLDRRMYQYRNPGPAQATNQRINARLVEHVADGGSVELSLSLRVLLDGDPLDLSMKSARVLGESLALVKAQRAGVAVENL